MVYPLYILEYTKFIHSICSVYTLYILGIYIVFFGDIQCIFFVYTLYIHEKYAYILHPVASVAEEGRVPFHLLHQQPHPSRLEES